MAFAARHKRRRLADLSWNICWSISSTLNRLYRIGTTIAENRLGGYFRVYSTNCGYHSMMAFSRANRYCLQSASGIQSVIFLPVSTGEPSSGVWTDECNIRPSASNQCS